jgi:hypothetical protein
VTTAVGTDLREVLRVERLEKGASSGLGVNSAAVGDVVEVYIHIYTHFLR